MMRSPSLADRDELRDYAHDRVARYVLEIRDNGRIVRVLQLVSRSTIIRRRFGRGVLRWLGRLGNKRAQGTKTLETIQIGMEKLTSDPD